MGRPKKYTKSTLDAAVRRYFASISRYVPATERVATGQLDRYGHAVYEDRPITNSLGEEVQILEYIVPPTVGGLCAYLGIHRDTWHDYCDGKKHPEFSDTAAYAGGCIRAWLEQQLLTRKDVKGIIFDLQNNHGLSERKQLELGERAGRAVATAAVAPANIPMAEKQALLEEIAREFGGILDGDQE